MHGSISTVIQIIFLNYSIKESACKSHSFFLGIWLHWSCHMFIFACSSQGHSNKLKLSIQTATSQTASYNLLLCWVSTSTRTSRIQHKYSHWNRHRESLDLIFGFNNPSFKDWIYFYHESIFLPEIQISDLSVY